MPKFSKRFVGIVVGVATMRIKTYSELIQLPTFLERFRYLQLKGAIGRETFGHDRYVNQILYQQSPEWRTTRRDVIVRDNGCDLGCEGFNIVGQPILVHHINPITLDDILNRDPKVLDPENLISTCLATHNAIHYGSEKNLIIAPVERTKNDTCPWKQT